MLTIQAALKKYWNYDTFRPNQEGIIISIMQRHDTLALLPTGGGKSLCYQIPAICMEGICVVVSPLVALMKDQVQHLNEKGIKSYCLTSDMNSHQIDILLNQCVHGSVKILYISPERLRQKVFVSSLRQMKVSLLAVDEAHCISQWGYDFRPAYLEIGKVRQYLPGVPVLALTATATPAVMEDIRKQLLFSSDSTFFKSSFYRPNIQYLVIKESDKYGRLLRILQTVDGSTIIYVRNRRSTNEIASFLCSHGIKASFYHAGLDSKIRDKHQLDWTKGLFRVMVATNAFGMGIDKADVRLVVHIDIPNSIEAYFQESGRAGRDGQKAYAVLLYNSADKDHLENTHQMAFPPLKVVRNVYRSLGNFYQVPIGSGEGQSFDFDIEAICRNYNFKIPEFYGALRLLEREGLIAIPDREEAESSVNILLSREEVYRYQMENVKYGDLLTILLRLYGGLFTSFVPISERKIASHYPLADEAKVVKMLLHLDALKIISYKKKASSPQIIFVESRVDDSDLMLSEDVYAGQERLSRARMESMIDYVEMQEGCRSQAMLAYFGETDSESCGVCDLCRTKSNKSSSAQPDIHSIISQKLSQKPMLIQQLVLEVCQAIAQSRALPMDESVVVAAVREMIDRQEISQSADFLLHYKVGR